MRAAIALMTFALLLLGACSALSPAVFENPPQVARIDRQRIERDQCMLAKAPQFDDHGADVRPIARRVAAACWDETQKLMVMAVPYADGHARLGFQQEAERRAADIVLTFRGVDNRFAAPRPGEPTPLSK
jgi:hypothetical protein